MGNTFNKTPASPFNKFLFTQLRQRTLSDLLGCYSIFIEDYPECQNMKFSEFEDVFGPMFDDADPFFRELQNDHDINGTVDGNAVKRGRNVITVQNPFLAKESDIRDKGLFRSWRGLEYLDPVEKVDGQPALVDPGAILHSIRGVGRSGARRTDT